MQLSQVKLPNLKNIPWNKHEAARAALCMLPMIVAPFIGLQQYMVPFGQAGFFYTISPVPQQKISRWIAGFMLVGLGMSFYMLAGTVASNLLMGVIFTFLIGLILILGTSWQFLGLLAFSFFSIYSAGLNAATPEKAAASIGAFTFALLWGMVVTLPKFWPGMPMPNQKSTPLPVLFMSGIKMGIGTSLAYLFSGLFHLSKLGWAPSAVGSVIRFDPSESQVKAKVRAIATVGGSLVAIFFFALQLSPVGLIVVSYLLGITNGFFKNTNLGKMPFFYTATILILYSLNDPASSYGLAIERVVYNMIGVFIALFIVWYPFPALSKRVLVLLQGDQPTKTTKA